MKAPTTGHVFEALPPVMRGTSLRILVVDRDRESLGLMLAWLETENDVEVFAYTSAEEALNQSQGDSFDLCLLDYGLDGVNGVMLGAMVRALNPGARLFLMSKLQNPQVERQAVEHGFEAVIAKPLVRKHLAEIVGRRLQ